MSRYLEVNDQQRGQVASNAGWGDFGRWADGLDEQNYGAVTQLWETGACDNAAALKQQLAKAINQKPPDKDVTSIGQGIIGMLADCDERDTVGITNGMSD